MTGIRQDNETDEAENGPGSRAPLPPFAGKILMAMSFYSRLPVPHGLAARFEIGALAVAAPVAGIAIGLIPAAMLAVLVWLVPSSPLFAAALALAAWVIVTGAMAEDGLADAADGLFGADNRESRLEILKDSRHGTYGVLSLVLSLLARGAALAWMAHFSPIAAALAWLGLGVVARSFALWLPTSLPSARGTGLAAEAGLLPRRQFGIGAASAALIFFVLALPIGGPFPALAALVVLAGTIVLWQKLCARLVGGQTGDLIGGGQALLEIAGLSAFMLLL